MSSWSLLVWWSFLSLSNIVPLGGAFTTTTTTTTTRIIIRRVSTPSTGINRRDQQQLPHCGWPHVSWVKKGSGLRSSSSDVPTTPDNMHGTNNNNNDDDEGGSTSQRLVPKLVIFDLDGCLWKPEMYELLYFSGGYGSPFTVSPDDPHILLTNTKNEAVYLLGDVRDVMKELYQSPLWEGIPVGISSRTDQPTWARELLEKFVVDADGSTIGGSTSSCTLRDVIQGPVQIASDSKVDHFQRIHQQTNIPFTEMIFFDNEWGNCKSVSSLGVTVGFTPAGVTRRIFDATVHAFPAPVGSVIRLPE
jgi:magnesium-dependent phosphatase 1